MDLNGDIGLALALTAIAGLSTGIGSTIAYFIRRPKAIYLCVALGFSAGVMIYVSFVELLPGSMRGVGEAWGVTAFFVGVIFIGIIDFIIPAEKNPHHEFKEIPERLPVRVNKPLMRAGVFTALAIAIHNFPEGLATFGTAMVDLQLGAVIAFAIAIHNIPEGIAVSVPIYYATGNRRKAFTYSFLSGVTEPLGAVIGFLILMPFLSEALLASMLAFVAGIMVYISLDELLPMAQRYGHGHVAIIGFIMGMFIMALSLLMF